MKKTFLILCALSATPSVAAVSDVEYAQSELKRRCRNSNVELPGDIPDAIASKNYVLEMIDYLNDNTTSYAVTSGADAISSSGYIKSVLNKLKFSSICCVTGFFSAETGRCESYGIYVPTGTCPSPFKEIPLSNSAYLVSGDTCPDGSEMMTTLTNNIESDVAQPVSACIPNIVSAAYTTASSEDKNWWWYKYGKGCKASGTEITCTDTLLTIEAHCSADVNYNSPEHGPYCWSHVTEIKTPSGMAYGNDQGWFLQWVYPAQSECNRWCGSSWAFHNREERLGFHRTLILKMGQ